MHLRVVTDQPWDVAADVLVIPVAPDPSFEGPLGELDRRSGGELRALAAFGELTGKRFATAVAAAGELPAGRLLAVGTGPLADLDRETVVHLGATVERRLAGRPVRTLAIWLGDLVTLRDGGAAAVAELLARGVVEGSFDPATLYRAAPEDVPPALDELILVAPGGRCDRPRGGRRARRDHRRGRQPHPPAREPRRERRQPRGAGRRGACHRRGPRPLDRRHRRSPRRRARHGHVPRRRPRQRQPAADDRRPLGRRGREGRPGPPPCPRRQGRLLRFRRHLHQAGRPDGGDEDGQDGGMHRARRGRDRRPPGPRHAAPRRRPGRREHARARTRPARATS